MEPFECQHATLVEPFSCRRQRVGEHGKNQHQVAQYTLDELEAGSDFSLSDVAIAYKTSGHLCGLQDVTSHQTVHAESNALGYGTLTRVYKSRRPLCTKGTPPSQLIVESAARAHASGGAKT